MGKVFLSYSRKDQDFVEQLFQRLKDDGVDCFFDKISIAWGADFVTELEKGIDNCDRVVLILSPDYCRSEWARIERTSAMAGLDKKLLHCFSNLVMNSCRVF